VDRTHLLLVAVAFSLCVSVNPLRGATEDLRPSADSVAARAGPPGEGAAAPRASGWEELLRPFVGVLVAPPRQVHPILVHFPIVFLLLEAIFTLGFRIRGRAGHDRWAFRCLEGAAVCLLPVAAAGFHDAGLDHGAGSALLLGLRDRWGHALRLSSPLTVHVWLVLALATITVVRLLLRIRERRRGVVGALVWVDGGLGFFGLWCLVATAYVGGSLSHG
jgi:uncharacterized membrane protein